MQLLILGGEVLNGSLIGDSLNLNREGFNIESALIKIWRSHGDLENWETELIVQKIISRRFSIV